MNGHMRLSKHCALRVCLVGSFCIVIGLGCSNLLRNVGFRQDAIVDQAQMSSSELQVPQSEESTFITYSEIAQYFNVLTPSRQTSLYVFSHAYGAEEILRRCILGILEVQRRSDQGGNKKGEPTQLTIDVSELQSIEREYWEERALLAQKYAERLYLLLIPE